MAYTVLLLFYTEKEKPINTSDLQQLLAGKKIVTPTWKLKVGITPFISVNHDNIFSADAYYAKFSHGMLPADCLQVDIIYDDILLESLNCLDNQAKETTLALVDDQIITSHILKFKLSGKTDGHTYHNESNNDVSWLLRLDLYIEDLCICGLLLDHKSTNDFSSEFYMGENRTHTLQIQTPIYRWLLQHDDYILQFYTRT